jgi:hypothetical protein
VEFQGERHSGCTHLVFEVEKAQLEVELMTQEMVRLWRPWVLGSSEQGNSLRRRKVFWSLKNVWHDLWDYQKRPRVIESK